MHRNAWYQRRNVAHTLSLIVLILCLPYAAFAGPKDRVVIRVKDSSQLEAVAKRYGLQINKKLNKTGSGGLLVVDGPDARKLKDKIKGDTAVDWLEDDAIILLDNGETVLALDDNGETVLALGVVVKPLDDNGETVLALDDNGETVLALDTGETVTSLQKLRIKEYFNWASRLLSASKTLLIQDPFLRIGLYDAQMRATGRGIIVADLNTGLDTCHPVLRGTLQVSFVDETSIPENCPTANVKKGRSFGHGTAVGGIIKLIAPESTLWSLRVFDSSGTAQASDIYEAIVYATDHGAKVINMSFGATVGSATLAEAMNYAYQRGVILFAAGGNAKSEGLTYPAEYSQVHGVVGLKSNAMKATFSNYGRDAFISAPGDKIWVPFPNRKMSLASGTSYASPMAAAEAALLLDLYGRNHSSSGTRAQVERSMFLGVQWIYSGGNWQYFAKLGSGRLYIPTAFNWMNQQ